MIRTKKLFQCRMVTGLFFLKKIMIIQKVCTSKKILYRLHFESCSVRYFYIDIDPLPPSLCLYTGSASGLVNAHQRVGRAGRQHQFLSVEFQAAHGADPIVLDSRKRFLVKLR